LNRNNFGRGNRLTLYPLTADKATRLLFQIDRADVKRVLKRSRTPRKNDPPSV